MVYLVWPSQCFSNDNVEELLQLIKAEETVAGVIANLKKNQEMILMDFRNNNPLRSLGGPAQDISKENQQARDELKSIWKEMDKDFKWDTIKERVKKEYLARYSSQQITQFCDRIKSEKDKIKMATFVVQSGLYDPLDKIIQEIFNENQAKYGSSSKQP